MASGDKFYLADKATLDEVKGKIGNTTDTGGSNTTGSVFGKLNYLVSQVSSYLSNIYNRIGSQSDTANSSTSSSTHAKLNWFLNLFGKTDDSGATVTSGTVAGKLNEILARGCVKSVQKGLITSDPSVINISISSINPSKSIVLVSFTNTSTTSYLTIAVGVRAEIVNSTTIKISFTSGVGYTSGANWQVIEFY
ncbi:hypothetical protein [Anaerotignum propionicum]|uniref:hypothetical protein n=1 Tax=Anaerotignum propionicum TaxID=28446 RepID=UPI002108AB37|nr:hypothetical protein [Anaerotignum propionicum]MCQ4935043.1 hypothetical protein [Anaerotignum propionicum]